MTDITHINRPRKIAIIGAGKIGTELWKELSEQGAADEIVVWNRSNRHEEEAFRATQSAVDQANIIRNGHRRTSQFRFTTDINEISGADIVIVTAGIPRKDPRQPRSELLKINCSQVIDPIARQVKDLAPDATYIIATNPVDTLTQRFQEQSGIAANKIVGLSGELDRSRMIQSICNQLKISPDYIEHAHVIGQHGPGMVPILSGVMIRYPGEAPRPLLEILQHDPDKLKEIIDATVNGGARYIKRAGTSDHIAPAAALIKMTDAICAAKWQEKESGAIYCSAYTQGDRSEQEGLYVGRPVAFNADGTYTCLPLGLEEHSFQDKLAWQRAVEECKRALHELPGHDQPLHL